MVVNGNPKAQGRPRACVRGAHASVYNPSNANGWKDTIYYETMKHRPTIPFSLPVRIDIKWRMPRPKRLLRKLDPEGEMPHTSKPDRDNLDKAVLDAMLGGGWFLDDCYVTAGFIQKVYHAKNGLPGADIVVWTYR